MIHYLRITNFGAIRDTAEMNFEVVEVLGDAYEVEMADGVKLMKLAYIYGANASGKTTILKAFEFLKDLLLKPAEDKSVLLDFEPFMFRSDPYGHSSFFELSFYLAGVRYVYSINFNREFVLSERMVYYRTAKPTEIFSRTTDTEKRLSKVQFGSTMKVSNKTSDLLEINILHNNTVLGAYAKTNIDLVDLEVLNIWLSVFLKGMVIADKDLVLDTAARIAQDSDFAAWMNKLVNKADQQILGIQVGEEEMEVKITPKGTSFNHHFSRSFTKSSSLLGSGNWFEFENRRKVDFIHGGDGEESYHMPLERESSGTQRYFALGGPLYDLIKSEQLLCIDELETSLHPDLMKYFLQVFLINAGDSQLLITTHNQSLMENQDFLRRDALWFCEKGRDGEVNFYSAADFDTSVLRKDASLINAYRAGRLGAKPNLGSPLMDSDGERR